MAKKETCMHHAYVEKKKYKNNNNKKKCQGTFGIPYEFPLFAIVLKPSELCIPS